MLPLRHRGGAVQPQVGHAVVGQELFENIQHPRHLCKDEHAVLAGHAFA